MCAYIKFYKKWTIANYISNRIEKKLCRAQVESDGGDDYIKSKYIIGNYERNSTSHSVMRLRGSRVTLPVCQYL